MAIRLIRWASTSCISRAIRVRSLSRPCSTRSACSSSARSARSRSVHISSRREPMYMPMASMATAESSPSTMSIPLVKPSERGWSSGMEIDETVMSRSITMICLITRRVARETVARVPGPFAVTETEPMMLVSAATVSGQRRRKKVSTRATRPSDRSSQNSHRASLHWPGAENHHSTALNATAAAMRQRCACQVSGGLYWSGLGRCTLLTLRAGGAREADPEVAATPCFGSGCEIPGADVRTVSGDETRCMITVDGVSKMYGGHTAVDDVSFVARPGRVTGFLGPNGAGKSTTMRIMVGLTPASRGCVTIGGHSYGDLPNPGLLVGVLLDASAQHNGRTGREILTIGAETMGLPRARVDEMLELVSLSPTEAKRRLRDYSLGMRQRLGIAPALLGDPGILILDEPANGLDPAGIHWMRGLLREYAGRGGTVLLSSHLLHEVEKIADDLVLIGRGRIVAKGTKQELLLGPLG